MRDNPRCQLCDQVIEWITSEDFGIAGSDFVSHPCGHITVNFNSSMRGLIREPLSTAHTELPLEGGVRIARSRLPSR